MKLNSLHERVLAAVAAACIQVVGAGFIATNINKQIQEEMQVRQAAIQAQQAKDELAQEIMSKYLAEYIKGITRLQQAGRDGQDSSAIYSQLSYSMDELTHAAFFFAPDELVLPLYKLLNYQKYGSFSPIEMTELMLEIRKAFVRETELTTGDYLEVLFPNGVPKEYR